GNAPTAPTLVAKTCDRPPPRVHRARVHNVARHSATLYATLPPSVDDDEADVPPTTADAASASPAADEAPPTDPAPAVNTPGTAGADRSDAAPAATAAPGVPRPDDLEFGAA